MPRDGWYSNQTSGQYIVRTQQRPTKPYVSGGFQSGLTAKERAARQINKQAAGLGLGGLGTASTINGNTMLSGADNFFSPQLSTDFLELPQSLREKREIYRHFYNSDELVGQAIDLHTELPLSKVRLAPPKPRTCPKGFKDAHDYGQYILSRFERMCQRIKLFQRLITIVHHYWLDGNCLCGESLVTVEGGVKYAKDVAVGDLVLTHKGRWRPVVHRVELEAPSTLSLDIARLPDTLRVTPEHPIEVLRSGEPCFLPASQVVKGDFVRITWPLETVDVSSVAFFDQSTPKYVRKFNNGYLVRRRQQLSRAGDAARTRAYILEWLHSLTEPVFRSRADIARVVAVPEFTVHNVLLTLERDVPFTFKVRVPSGEKDGPHTLWLPLPHCDVGSASSYEIERDWYFESPTSLELNEDFLYVLGYWLGDGSIGRDSARDTEWGRGIWSVTGHDCSLDYLARVEASLVSLLGRAAVSRSLDLRNGARCHTIRVIGSPAFLEWWSRTFGDTSHGQNPKRIPRWVLTLPEAKQLAVLGGLIDSDGCVPRTQVGGVEIGLTSLQLIAGIRDLMLRLGAVPSLTKSDHVGEEACIQGRTFRHNHPSYLLSVKTEAEARYLASKACKRDRLDEAPRFFTSATSYQRVGDNVYFLVRGTSEEPGEPVFNFQVEEDETFRAHFVSTHNCAIFAEDSAVDTPMEVGHDLRVERRSEVTANGEPREFDEEVWTPKSDAEAEELGFYQKNYAGWQRVIILPIDKVKVTTFSFTDQVKVELIPSDRDRALLDKAKQGDPVAQEMSQQIPAEVRQYMEEGRLIPMGTDPDEGSFVFLLTARKHADSEIGQSILDRCHLPGTPVLARRDGQVLEVPIEELDPDTDLVLSGKGIWREFEHGVRAVDEVVTVLEVSKIEGEIASTPDHRYPVLRDGKVVELEASAIEPGDYLQVAQVPLTESRTDVDFGEFLHGIREQYKARRSGAEVVQTIEVIDRTATAVVVRYSKPETNPRLQTHLSGLEQAARWLGGLVEPTTIRALEFCKRFGFGHAYLGETLEKLRGVGACFEMIGRSHAESSAFDVRFHPAELRPLEANRIVTKSFPPTLKLDGDAGYFLGYWLGDGHIAKRLGVDYGVLGLTYGPGEAASVLALDTMLKPFLDKMKVAWSESPMLTGMHLDGYQDALVRWMAASFGHTGEDKHLPDWIFDAPKSFLWALLRGFVDSDGDVTQKRDGSVSVRMSGSNPVLMSQVFLLCTSLGIPVSKTRPIKARMVKQADGRLSLAKPAYAVHFTHGPSVKGFFDTGFLAKHRNPDVWKDGRSGSRHRVHDGRLYYRVKSVGTGSHRGPVYSLNVHGDHSFHAGHVSTCNCLRTLYFREKLRQAQTSIASRAMTPKRIVWAEGLSDSDTEQLRQQVDLALVDPDYSIVANYEIRWEEMGARDRLLDLSSEYEQTERRLLSGLGVTESLMSGESLYSGDRLKLEVINTRYLHLREILQDYVELSLFKPVARRMGFVEQDEWGQEVVLYPRLSFTRLPLRDTQDTYDALFNLYQKGSVSIDLILEMFNIDPDETRQKLERDLFTVNDAMFNEVVRSLGNEVGRMLAEKTDVVERVAQYLKFNVKPAPPAEEGGGGGGRFG